MPTTQDPKTLDQLLGKKTTGTVTDALQANLLDLIKLGLSVKQAHWNLAGPQFLTIHEFLDKVYAEVQEYTDQTAERVRQLDAFPNGNADAVAASTTIEKMPLGKIKDLNAVEEVLNRIEATVKAVRERLETFEEDEVVSADLVHAHLFGLENRAWMLRATLGRD
ncbi:DNA starvation/stationary phase protection protein [bacterium]|nr:MAG: DNA starvation/stationary phase protection protein [bacterium]